MALRQWMVPHEWMVKPLPQTEWIERKGLLVWLAEVSGSIGAGLYIVSALFGSLPGMAMAWLVIMLLKMLPHLLYLGRPSRFWRALPPFSNAWRTSWIARGLVFTTAFACFAFFHLIVAYFFPGSLLEAVFRILGGVTAFLVGIYGGFVLSCCRSVPFWNSALLPLLLLLVGIADGFALIIAVGFFDPNVDAGFAEAAGRVLLTLNSLIMAVYLWKSVLGSTTARFSATLLLRGRLAPYFWSGVVAFGIIVPFATSLYGYVSGGSYAGVLVAAIILHTAGSATLKYCLLKAGFHAPVLLERKPTIHIRNALAHESQAPIAAIVLSRRSLEITFLSLIINIPFSRFSR